MRAELRSKPDTKRFGISITSSSIQWISNFACLLGSPEHWNKSRSRVGIVGQCCLPGGQDWSCTTFQCMLFRFSSALSSPPLYSTHLPPTNIPCLPLLSHTSYSHSYCIHLGIYPPPPHSHDLYKRNYYRNGFNSKKNCKQSKCP